MRPETVDDLVHRQERMRKYIEALELVVRIAEEYPTSGKLREAIKRAATAKA